MRLLATFLLLASSALAQSSTGGNQSVTSSTSGLTGSVLGSRAWAPGPQYPYAPLSVPDATPPNTSGYTSVTSSSIADLQSKVTAAACNTVINIPQAASYNAGSLGATGLVLPSVSCSAGQWIVIQEASFAMVRDTRIDPSTQVGTIPKLTTASVNGNVISCAANTACGPFWIRGLEIEGTVNGNIPVLVGDPTDTPANLPNNLVFDHDYIHGRVANTSCHGILYAANNFILVDSWISDMHGTECQAVNAYTGGPHLWKNNFLEGSGEDILLGGSNVGTVMTQYGIVIHDLTEDHNWYFKPLQWMALGTSPLYTGLHWPVKNMHEYKGCVRCAVKNFVMQGNWIDGQTGTNILLNNATSQNGVYTQTTDVRIGYGKVIGGAALFQQTALDASITGDTPREYRVMFEHVVADHITNDFCGNGTPLIGACAANTYSSMSGGVYATIQNHITSPQVKTTSRAVSIAASGNPLHDTQALVYFANSIVTAGSFGFNTNGGSSNSVSSYNQWWGGGQLPTILNNAVTGMGTVVSPSGACTTWYTGTTCPADMMGIGFVNWSSGNGGDYRLCTGVNLPAAPCAGASTYLAGGANGCTVNPDGTGGPMDCGADIATINSRTAGVDTVPSLWPDSLSGGGILLTPSSLTCNNSNTLVITPVAGTNGGGIFVQSGLDVMYRGALITPTASSTSSITIRPPTYSGAATITAWSITSKTATITATQTYKQGEVVTITGSDGGVLDGTYPVFTANTGGVSFTIILNQANTSGTTGTISSAVPITVNNFGLPLTAGLTCI